MILFFRRSIAPVFDRTGAPLQFLCHHISCARWRGTIILDIVRLLFCCEEGEL